MPKLKYSSLIFVSRNMDKYSEYCTLLGVVDLKLSKIEITEPQSMLLDLLVTEKIRQIENKLPGSPFFVEHTGLIIQAWKGLPGGLTSIFMDTVRNEGICKMMRGYKGAERTATARVVIGCSIPGVGITTFNGEVTGVITEEPRGNSNFGWDPIFIPNGSDKTYGEMTLAEKNVTSIREQAAKKFTDHLTKYFEL